MRGWNIMSKKSGMFLVIILMAAVLYGCAGAREEDKIANSDTGLQKGNKNISEEETLQDLIWSASSIGSKAPAATRAFN